MKKLLLLFFLFPLVVTQLKAQDDDSTNQKDKRDWNWNWDWDWDKEWFQWRSGDPFIELNYGISEFKHDKLSSKIGKAGEAEIKLGYSTFYECCDNENIVKFIDKYAFISKVGTKLHSQKATYEELTFELLRFGFGKRTGYGYDYNSVRIMPYSQEAAVWSKLDMKDYPVSIFPSISFNDAMKDTEILQRYDGEFRFGTLNEGGIRLELASLISLNAGYEAGIIFPRHLFWKQLASYAIESIAQHTLDNFIREVVDSSPYAGPIVNFVLKNGLSYAFYTLKKEKMNWPFNTETPLTYEGFKFGVTFTF